MRKAFLTGCLIGLVLTTTRVLVVPIYMAHQTGLWRAARRF